MPLCSSCNEPITPVIAVDVDGTLGDFHRHFLEFAEMYIGKVPWLQIGHRNYDGQRSFREWFCDIYRVDETTWSAIKLAYRQGGMKRSMPPTRYAKAFMKWLHAKGLEVWITTTRPHLSLDNIEPDTVHWLERNDIPFDHMLFGDDKYEQLVQRVEDWRIVAVLDDQIEDLSSASFALDYERAILLRGHWNRGVHWAGPAAIDFGQAKSLINERLKEWKAQYA